MSQEVIIGGKHPRVVAKALGFSFWTIYRWIKSGYLRSCEGKVLLSDVQQIVNDLERSLTRKEVRQKLGIHFSTVESLKQRGILEFINVAGTERALKSSVDKILKVKKGRRTNFHPEYVPVYDLLKVTGLESGVLNRHIASGAVKSELVNGKRMIPIEEYNSIKELMDSTLRSMDVARILGKSNTTIRTWRETGRLREVTVLGNKRVAVDSIAKTPKDRQRLKAFMFKPIRVPELGKVKVYSRQQVCERLKKSRHEVDLLFKKGTLRGRLVDGEIYILASSLDVYEQKNWE